MIGNCDRDDGSTDGSQRFEQFDGHPRIYHVRQPNKARRARALALPSARRAANTRHSLIATTNGCRAFWAKWPGHAEDGSGGCAARYRCRGSRVAE
jgi:hypothetical protein